MAGKESTRQKVDRLWLSLVLFSNPIMYEEIWALVRRFAEEDNTEDFVGFFGRQREFIGGVLRENCRRATVIFRNLLIQRTPFRTVVVENLLDYLQKEALLPSEINLSGEELVRLISDEPETEDRESWLRLLETRLAMDEVVLET